MLGKEVAEMRDDQTPHIAAERKEQPELDSAAQSHLVLSLHSETYSFREFTTRERLSHLDTQAHPETARGNVGGSSTCCQHRE